MTELALPFKLPPLVLTPTAAQLFMFSAATWNRHQIHYSPEAARAEGHADIVVQRGLVGNFLARLLTNYLGDRGEVRALSWKVFKSAVPGTSLRCEGEITAQSGKTLRCDVRLVDANANTIATGQAELELIL